MKTLGHINRNISLMHAKFIVKISLISLLFTIILGATATLLIPNVSISYFGLGTSVENDFSRPMFFWLAVLLSFGLSGMIQYQLFMPKKAAQSDRAFHSLSKYQAILQTTPDGFWIVDTQGQLLEVNPALSDMLGYSEKELLSLSIADIEANENPEEIVRHIHYIKSSGSDRFDTRLIRKDGAVIHAEVSALYLPESGDQIVVFIRDVTDQRRLEKHLCEEEELQRKILQTSPVSIHAIDTKGRVILWNDASAEIMGWSAEDILGEKLPILPDRKQEEHMNLRRRVLQGESISQFETIRKRRDGTEFPCSLSVSPLFNQDGSIYGVVGFLEDITERKEAESALQRSEQKFREIFHQANDAIYLHAVDENGLPVSFLEVNQTACRMLGYTQEEFLQMSPMDINASDLNDQNMPVMEQLFTQGNLQFTGNHLTKSGDPVPVELHADYFTLDGEPRVLSVVRDISDRKAAERAILETQERLQLAVNASNIGLWDWNVQTGETTFNEQWAQLVGYTLQEIAPTDIHTWMELAHPDDLDRSNELLQAHFQGDTEYYDCEARMRHKAGHWIWVRDRGKVIEWAEDGKPLRMIGTHVDITSAKEREAQKENQLSQFQKMVDPIDQGVGILDHFNNIIYINKVAAQLFGHSAQEMIGTPLTAHLGQSDWQTLKQVYREKRAQSQTTQKPVRLPASRITGLDGGKNRFIEIWPFDNKEDSQGIVFRIDSTSESPLFDRLRKESVQSSQILTLCSSCYNVKQDIDTWVALETYIMESMDLLVSHGLCPGCLQEMMRTSFEANHMH